MTLDPKHQQRPTFDICSTAFPIAYERTCMVEGHIRSSCESFGVLSRLDSPFFSPLRSLKVTMSQIHSLDARLPAGEVRYSIAYSGQRFSPSTGRSRPDTRGSRATTTTKVPNVKQSYFTTTPRPRSRSPSQRAPTTNRSTERSDISQQKKPSALQRGLVPVSRDSPVDDAKSMRSGYSEHGAEPAHGARLGELSADNVWGLGPSTGGRQGVLNSWVGGSLKSAKSKRSYQVVKYREGFGPQHV